MEPRFGHDFSGVRLHTDAKAVDSAQAVNALAYTVGRDIVFGTGQYAPETRAGRTLLAHELAHVVQVQGEGLRKPMPVRVGQIDSLAERQADAVASRIDQPNIQGIDTASAPARVLYRQTPASTGGGSAAASTTTPTANPPAAAAQCLRPVAGEEIDALLESGAVTIVEYGADSCEPCHMLQDDLTEICQQFGTTPPPVTVRFFSVDIADPRNAENARRHAPGAIPRLAIYVGTTLKHNSQGRPAYEQLRQLIAEQVSYVSTSGAARGALTGLYAGLGIGSAAGLATGIGLAASGILTGEAALAGVFGLAAAGGAIGLGIGAGIGAIVGALTDDRGRAKGTRVGFFEAETLIRRQFQRYLPRASGPLHDATIRAVTQIELQMWNRCRHPGDRDEDLSTLVGWTDLGPEPPNTIASAEQEPVCANGQRLEHATPAHPVIYYARDRQELTVLIHEGLHAYAHPNFTAQMRNMINEGATQYLTRQLAREIGIPDDGTYAERVSMIERLVPVIGEDALQEAYFHGDFRAANRVLGPCGLEVWAQLLQQFRDSDAEEILQSTGQNHCNQVRVFPTGAPAQSGGS
jgi:hypothetical protein